MPSAHKHQGNAVDSDIGADNKLSGRDMFGSTKRRPVIEPIEEGLAGLTEIPKGKHTFRRDGEGAARIIL